MDRICGKTGIEALKERRGMSQTATPDALSLAILNEHNLKLKDIEALLAP